MTLETKFKNLIKKESQDLGINFLKFSPGPYSPIGIPDVYLYKGNIGIWVELKVAPNKMTKLQANKIATLPYALCITEYPKERKYVITETSPTLANFKGIGVTFLRVFLMELFTEKVF